MKISKRGISRLAEFICGASGSGGSFDHPQFPYRTAGQLTQFFCQCDIEDYEAVGTRVHWVEEALAIANELPSPSPDFPSPDILRVIIRLFDDPPEWDSLDQEQALSLFNRTFAKDNIKVEIFDGQVQVKSRLRDVTSAAHCQPRRHLSKEEEERRLKLLAFLEKASEDEFTERLLFPMLAQLGFEQIELAGHRDKALEYGKDLWFKFKLPTLHYIYFGLQSKRGNIHARGGGARNLNCAELINQAKMMLSHEIFDPGINRRVLVDHAIISVSGSISKQARNFIGQNLDREQRRHILFMDKDHLLQVFQRLSLDVPECVEKDSNV